MITPLSLHFTVFATFLVVFELSASPLITRKLSGEQTAIGGTVTGAQISPDGKYAVYRGDLIHEGIQELFSIRIEGGSPIKISSGQYLTTYNTPLLHISPDSAWVYFLSGGEIFRTPIDGSAMPALAHGDLGFLSTDGDDWITRSVHELQLSNDGRYLYFYASSYTDGAVGVPHNSYQTDLFRIDFADHSPAENITVGTAVSRHHISRIQVSDDDRYLLINAFSSESDFGVFHLDLTTASATRLQIPAYISNVALSPDGSHVLVNGREELFTFPGTLFQFPPLLGPEAIIEADPRDPYAFEYSSDSRWILFRTNNGLFKRPTAGGEPSLISSTATATERLYDAAGNLVFSANSTVNGASETHLFSLHLDGDAPPTRLTQHPLMQATVEQSPDRRSLLFFEQMPSPEGSFQQQLMIARIDRSSAPQQLSDADLELPEYPAYRNAMFVGQFDRVIYTKGRTYHAPEAIYTVTTDSPPELVARTESGEVPQALQTSATTDRVFFYQGGALFETEPGSESVVQLSFSTAIGADVSAVKLTPDGTQAIFRLDAEEVNRPELFAVPSNGGVRRKLNHQLTTDPIKEYIGNFWLTPNGQVIYSTSLYSIYSVDPGNTAPAALLQKNFVPLEPNLTGRFLLGLSGGQLTAIDLNKGTTAVTEGRDGRVGLLANQSSYSTQDSGTRAIYVVREPLGYSLMSWPLDGSTPPIDLAPGDRIVQFTVAPSIDRVIYRSDSGDVFSVPTGGGNRLQLLADQLIGDRAFFSATADGQWLIYSSANSYWKVSTWAGGSAPINLTEHLDPDQYIFSIAIATDGTKLAYAASIQPQGMKVYAVELDGQTAPQELYSTAISNYRAKLIPAGDHFLLFAYIADYDLKLLSLPNTSGSPPTILDSTDNQRTRPIDDNFVLSADHSRIIFVEGTSDLYGNSSYALVTAPTDGSTRGTAIGSVHPTQFASSSDGRTIAYISNRENATIDELFVTKVNPDPQSYDGWLVQHFPPDELAASERELNRWHRNADPDADGIENWLERLTALNPLEAEHAAPYELIFDSDAKSYCLRFRSAKDLPRLPTIECSYDLANWQAAAKTVRVISDSGDAWLLETEIDRGGSKRTYVRIREEN